MSESVIIIGASGHGKVIADIVIKSGDKVVGFHDPDAEKIFLQPVAGIYLGFYLPAAQLILRESTEEQYQDGYGQGYEHRQSHPPVYEHKRGECQHRHYQRSEQLGKMV